MIQLLATPSVMELLRKSVVKNVQKPRRQIAQRVQMENAVNQVKLSRHAVTRQTMPAQQVANANRQRRQKSHVTTDNSLMKE